MKIILTSTDSSFSISLQSMKEPEVQKRLSRFAQSLINEDERRMTKRYKVQFIHCGERKIECIKAIRNVMSLGLKEAKDASEMPPHILFETTDKREAERLCRDLREAGATAELVG